MKYLPNIHPGELLKEEFLLPMEISAYRLAKSTGLSETRISQIINGKRGITAETAVLLGSFFGNSPEFWMNLQNHYDLEEVKRNKPLLAEGVISYKQLKPKA